MGDISIIGKQKQKLAIFGAGGQGREVLQLIRQINEVVPTWECIGWFDDGIPAQTVVADLPVLGGLMELNNWSDPLAIAIAIALPRIKAKIISRINNPYLTFPALIHPSVKWETAEVQIGKGTIITQGCRMTVNIKIGDFVLLNLGTVLTHDVVVEDYCSLMPSVNISGAVMLEEGCYIGTGTQVIQLLRIGAYATIGAGSVVIANIPAKCTAVGVPTKIIKSSF